ncbi:hypothetical protein MMAG44476_14405 [Mycolicibacterium mageritense DSM 44476 = CIP 104973]|uniref:DUF2188 domain-containing protein n=1 Tax=Mycolicibacterium mageritense TaxID=53462 RepID=A0ABM7HSW1_MYCME|nr:hypothetical protein MMAGJ_29310 [Mycolicibacterium mageritense]CDO22077.1 hypothetical protein BN978_02542 [Mycolicibacterium mageritense DSM 44476 = CIP 104973]
MTDYRIAETPLGALLTADGEQVGENYADTQTAITAAAEVMRSRGDSVSGTWVLDWDDGYRWTPNATTR